MKISKYNEDFKRQINAIITLYWMHCWTIRSTLSRVQTPIPIENESRRPTTTASRCHDTIAKDHLEQNQQGHERFEQHEGCCNDVSTNEQTIRDLFMKIDKKVSKCKKNLICCFFWFLVFFFFFLKKKKKIEKKQTTNKNNEQNKNSKKNPSTTFSLFSRFHTYLLPARIRFSSRTRAGARPPCAPCRARRCGSAQRCARRPTGRAPRTHARVRTGRSGTLCAARAQGAPPASAIVARSSAWTLALHQVTTL